MNEPERPADPPPFPPPASGAGPVVAAVLIGVGLVPVALGGALTGWAAEQLTLVTSGAPPWWSWPVIGLLLAILAAGPAALLAFVPRSPAVRTTGRAWLTAAAVAAAGSALRAVPAVQHEAYLALLALLAGAAAVLVRRGRGGSGRRWPAVVGGPAVAAGVAVALPWLWVGALGGLLETVLAAGAAAAVGLLAAGILDARFWRAYATGPVRLVLLGGTVAAVTLLLLAAGTGQSGAHLAELLVLPPLGYALAALYALGARAGTPGTAAATAAVVGIAVFAPLGFVDPQEVTLLLATDRDVPYWAGVAAVCSWVVAVLVGIGYAVAWARRGSRVPHRLVGPVAAGLLLVGAVVVYAGPGHPGLYGERLLVILDEQADLSGVTGTGAAGRDARAAEVYRRLVRTAEDSQADLRRTLNRWHLSYTPYYLLNAVEVTGGPGLRAWLSARGDVDRVLVGQRLRPLPEPPGTTRGDAAAPTGTPWNIALIGADRARRELGVDGRGIVVGTSDSGVDGTHPALRATFRGGDDSWFDPWNGTDRPVDHGGHGTHTLGSAVGSQGIGVAPGARWAGCVNLDRNLGNPASYLDCLQFMLAPFPPGGDPFVDGRPARGPQVLTNSWGCPDIEGCDRATFRAATAAFAAAGTFFVAAAGNSGPGCSTVDDPPATYPDVVSVGAVDADGAVADFSSRGPAPDGTVKPDISAPGAGVLSALPGGTYGTLDGTSMAAPHVAGVVALMWSANPALIGDLAGTRRILTGTATPVPAGGRGCGGAETAGAGRVDAYAAVRAALDAR